MKIRKSFGVITIIGMILLSGCQTANEKAPKEKLDEGTNTEAALYTLKEQKDVLKSYSEFYSFTYLDKNTEKDEGTYIVPGLVATETLALNKPGKPSESETMDPQGVTVTEDYVLISAYSHDKKHNSVIYVLDKGTHKYIKTVVLQGKPHVGGLTYDSESQNIWVCSLSKEDKAQIVSISLKDLEDYQLSPDYEPINYQQKIDLKDIKRASYITYYDNSLYVGYFSEKHEAVLEKYLLADDGKFIDEVKHRTILTAKKENATPDEIDQVTHGIQGITIYKDYLLLSQSYGPENSKILVYDNINKERVFMDKETVKEIEAPPYLEQISINDDELYTVFESATKKYRDNNSITKVDRVIKLDLTEVEELKR